MSNIDLLTEAINSRKPISFEYNKPGKTPGERIGNPFALFIFVAKSGAESTKVHIVQIDGVTDSVENFPEFRQFNIEHLSNVSILTDWDKFDAEHEKYKPESPMYKNVIAKV